MEKTLLKILGLMGGLAAAGILLTGCGSDDNPDSASLSKISYTLYHNETCTLEGSNLDGQVWSSGNDYVARVSDNVITGYYVGETTVNGTGKLQFSVTVEPKYNLYEEPVMDWGMSMSSFEKIYGTPYTSTSTALMYETQNSKAPYALYLFSDSEGLKSSSIVVKSSYTETLLLFLEERYVPISVDSSTLEAYFVHAYGSSSDPQYDLVVYMSYNSSYKGFLVMYVPYSSLTKGASREDMLKEIKCLYEEMS